MRFKFTGRPDESLDKSLPMIHVPPASLPPAGAPTDRMPPVAAAARAAHGRAGPASGFGGLAAYAPAPEPARRQVLRVEQAMGRGVFTVAEQAPLADAWQLLQRHAVEQLPVTTGAGVLCGLLPRRDLLQPPGADPAGWKLLADQPVASLMVRRLPTLHPDSDLRAAARALAESGLPGLPVSDAAGRVAGVLARGDLVRVLGVQPPLDLWS